MQQLSQRGQWMFGFQWNAGPLYVAHRVLPSQLEIDPETGRARPIQAMRHQLWLWTMDLNLFTQLGILPWLNVRFQLPVRYVQVTARYQDQQGNPLPNYTSIHHRDEILVGLGDPDLQVGFRPLSPTIGRPWLLEFGGGISLPVGRTEPDPYVAGEEGREHQHVMFGTGTFDPVGYLILGYIRPKFQLYSNATIRAALYPNSFAFQEGIRFQASLAAESGFGLKTLSFLLQTTVIVKRPGYWSGVEDQEVASGRTDLLFTVGMFWRPTPQWQVSLRASAPVNVHLDGESDEDELTHPIILGLGLTYRFRLYK